jgi:hypothetical protein
MKRDLQFIPSQMVSLLDEGRIQALCPVSLQKSSMTG